MRKWSCGWGMPRQQLIGPAGMRSCASHRFCRTGFAPSLHRTQFFSGCDKSPTEKFLSLWGDFLPLPVLYMKQEVSILVTTVEEGDFLHFGGIFFHFLFCLWNEYLFWERLYIKKFPSLWGDFLLLPVLSLEQEVSNLLTPYKRGVPLTSCCISRGEIDGKSPLAVGRDTSGPQHV